MLERTNTTMKKSKASSVQPRKAAMTALRCFVVRFFNSCRMPVAAMVPLFYLFPIRANIAMLVHAQHRHRRSSLDDGGVLALWVLDREDRCRPALGAVPDWDAQHQRYRCIPDREAHETRIWPPVSVTWTPGRWRKKRIRDSGSVDENVPLMWKLKRSGSSMMSWRSL